MPIEIFGGQAEYEKRLLLDEKKKNILQQHGDYLYIIKYDEFDTEKIIGDIKKLLYNENS